MTALAVPGNSGLPDDAFTWRFLGGPEVIEVYDSTFTVNALSKGVLLGADLTMTGATGVGPCFASLAIGGVTFYWDSQSTGEGSGITFAWRGQLPIIGGDQLHWYASQPGSDLSVSSVMWGYVNPRVVTTPHP